MYRESKGITNIKTMNSKIADSWYRKIIHLLSDDSQDPLPMCIAYTSGLLFKVMISVVRPYGWNNLCG
jgi:hypothetical protein